VVGDDGIEPPTSSV